MDNLGWVAIASIVTAGITIGAGAIGPALGEGRALAREGGGKSRQSLLHIDIQPLIKSTINIYVFYCSCFDINP